LGRSSLRFDCFLLYYITNLNVGAKAMKTIVKNVIEEDEPATSYLRRVKNKDASLLVREGEWKYTSKQQWKTEVRDLNKNETPAKQKKTKKDKKK
jgi:hypothetical protein